MASAPPRLHRAAARCQLGNLKQYLNAGDDVNARDPEGVTALLVAVRRDCINCTQILLAAGADPSISDNGHCFPLYLAAQSRDIAIATALIQAHANINAIIDRPECGTALCPAAFTGNKAMVKLLLDAGCDPSKSAADGHHPLAMASVEGHTDVVTLFLDAGVDVNATGAGGISALTAGAQKGSSDVIKILLQRGADVNQQDPDGGTALHTAAERGFDEVINVLIAAGAAVDHLDAMRGTPLHTAVYFGKAKCAWALLRAGANVSFKDLDGSTLLHIAASKGFTDVIEVLLSAGGHADVDLEDNKHRTPLISASAFADAKAVNLLLDAGADVNKLTKMERTALFAPSDVKIVKALLDRGANAKVLDNYGSTVLHLAGLRGACAGVICALYRAGADPTVKNRGGATAADIARYHGHEDAAKLLDLLAAKHRAKNIACLQPVVREGEEGSGNAEAMTNKVLNCVFLLAAVCVAYFLVRGKVSE